MTRRTIFFILFILLSCFKTNSGAEEKGYHLAPGDLLEISVWKDKDLSRQFEIPPDGILSFPLIGDVDANNMTVPELRRGVKARLEQYIPDPTVTVMLLKPGSMTAYVIGKVNKPGQFPINGETNVMQLLAMAGGLNPFAAPKDIIVLRQEGEKTVKIPFNYREVEDGENLGQNIILDRGDVVVVP